jgi:hypothetical protein
MLRWFLENQVEVSDRKFRLFGCVCVRDVWEDLPHDALRRAIETCERFADGRATEEELRVARDAADARLRERVGDIITAHSSIAITELCGLIPTFPLGTGSSSGIPAVAAEARCDEVTPWDVAWERANQLYCRYFRDIFGNPFRPVAFNPAWRTDTAVSLARGMYDSREFGAMPILADALQDAGCEDEQVLTHCRDANQPHVRGCWVCDFVLGKE